MKLYHILVALICICLATSCADFDQMNINPNNPSSENPASENILASCMRKAFHEDRFEHWRGQSLHAERFANHIQGGFELSWWGPDAAYTYNESWVQGVWNCYNSKSENSYGGALFANLKIIESYYLSHPDEKNAKEYIGISKVLTAFQFLKITDLFGDIPFSEHGDIDVPTPKYDSQEEIYNQLEIQLKDAVENYLNEDKTIHELAEYDIVYSGEVVQWQKFANSLRLRMAIRRSDVDEAGAKTILQDLANYPIIESNDDNVSVPRTTSTEYLQGQYWGVFAAWKGTIPDGSYTWDGYNLTWGVGDGAYVAAKEIIEVMKGSEMYASEVTANPSTSENINIMAGIEDPRLDKFFMRPKGDLNAEHIGMPSRAVYRLNDEGKITQINTDVEVKDRHNYSWMHPSIWYDGGTWNPVRFEYAEICFEMAEAVERGLVSSSKSAETWLTEGVQASCNRWNANDNGFSSEVALRYSSSSLEDKIAIIATQRWIAAYTTPRQAWAVVRRTGHPQIVSLDRDATITGEFTEADKTVVPNKTMAVYAAGSTEYVLPQRMRIPDQEMTINPNVPESGKSMKNKMWWSK